MENKISICVFFSASLLFLFFSIGVSVYDSLVYLNNEENYTLGPVEELIGVIPFNLILGGFCLIMSISFFKAGVEVIQENRLKFNPRLPPQVH